MMRASHIICILLVLTLKNYALNFNFRHYKVEDGLSENSVLCILQDNKGFMWFGTKDGLNRFDGHNFLTFHHKVDDKFSIGNNFIRSLFLDKAERIWVGTEQGVFLYNQNLKQFSFFDKATANNEQITQAVNSICQDISGNIWLATTNGLFKYTEKTGTIKSYATSSQNMSGIVSGFINSVICDSRGIVWIGTLSGGIGRYNPDKDNFTTTLLSKSKDTFNNSVLKIIEDSQGNLIFGTVSEGLVFYDRKSGESIRYLTELSSEHIYYFRDVFEYSPGKYLVGSEHGLVYFDKSKNKYIINKASSQNGSISDNAVYSVKRDKEGGIWVGTYFGGVNYITPKQSPFELFTPSEYKNSVSGKAISQMCEDANGSIWIATEDGGLNYFDTKSGLFKNFKHVKGENSLSFHNVHSILQDGNLLWIGTFAGGLNVLNTKTGKFKYYNTSDNPSSISDNNVFSIYKDLTGNIWIGTINGLNKYNPGTDNFQRISELSTHTHVYDILQDHNGWIWVATYGRGVFCFDPQRSVWTHYQHNPKNNETISHSKVISIHLDEKRRLWFGTEGGGLCQYIYEKKIFKTFNTENGLPNNVIYMVVSERDNLWLSTNKGLVCFIPETNKIRIFTKADGLQGEQFNFKSALKTRSGKIYFGGTNGFNAFYPEKISENKFVPPVLITTLQVFNNESVNNTNNKVKSEDISNQKRIVLKHNQTNIGIEFVALSYCVPEKNQYAYKLDGLDSKWNYIGNERKISYANLSPGIYTLHIKASNNDGVWNETGTQLVIEVLPPIWKSTWAITFYIIILLISGYYIFIRLKKKHLNEQMQHLEKVKSEKEIELYNAKIDFFTNIAHEIRTPLSLIKAPLDTIRKKFSSPEADEYLEVIHNNTNRLLALVNQLLDFRKAEKNSYKVVLKPTNINELVLNIADSFKYVCSDNNINLKVLIPNENLVLSTDPESLTKILTNLISNALKHARKEIVLKIEKTDTCIEFRIQDDGIGIVKENFDKIFQPFFQIHLSGKPTQGTGIGLSLAKLLAELMSGSLNVQSEQGKFCCFILSLPHTFTGNIDESSFQTKHPDILIEKVRPILRKPKDKDKNIELFTILIVEDNIELNNYLSKCFVDDYSIISALNGLEALKHLENLSPDIIITDIVMPEMDGLTLCQQLKTNTLYSHIPVIMLTAKTDIQHKIEGIEVGADAYIEKPFSIEHLEAQIVNLLENRDKLRQNFINSPLSGLKSFGKNKADGTFLHKTIEIIEFNITNVDFSVDELSQHLNMSRSNLHRKLKGISGLSPNDFIRLIRLKKAVKLMEEGESRINEICFMVGFNSPSYFAKCFQKQFGVLPKEYIKK